MDHPMNNTRDWGKGMLMTGREFLEIQAFDEQLSLRELRAKVNGKAGVGAETSGLNRYSIDAEFNYGSRSVDITRKYLDSGVLVELVEKEFGKDRCWNGGDAHRYLTLAACAMTLGCKLPESMTDGEGGLAKMVHPAYLTHLGKLYPTCKRSPLAIDQFKTALNNYQPGNPYSFGKKTFLECTIPRMMPLPGKMGKELEIGASKLIKNMLPGGKVIPQIIGPPSDEEMNQVRIYPVQVCASCGAKQGQEGKELSVCSRCQDRKYCSKECQKKHWKVHKIICTQPADRMKGFLDSIPLDFVGDLDKMFKAVESL